MKKILYKEISAGPGLLLEREGPYEGPLEYPVVAVRELKARLSTRSGKPYPRCHLLLKALLLVRDAIDDERFEYPVELDERFDAMKGEDDVGEGILFPEEGLTLEEIALSFVYRSLPIRLTREGAKLPPDGDGYTVS